MQKILPVTLIVLILAGIAFWYTGKRELAAGTKEYSDSAYGFTLTYPENITPRNTFTGSYLTTAGWSLLAQWDMATGSPVVALELPGSNEITTGQVRVGVSSDPLMLAACEQSPKESNIPITRTTIGATSFAKLTLNDAAMSHFLNATIYRTLHNNLCYSVEAILYGTNPAVYDPPRSVPFSSKDASRELDLIAHSLVFTK